MLFVKSLRKQIIFTKLTLRPYLLLHNWQSRLIYGDVFTYSIFVHYVIKCLDLDHFDCLESISNATKFLRNCFQILKVIIKYPTQSIESSTFCLKILNDNWNLNGHDLYLTFSKKLLWNVDLVFCVIKHNPPNTCM